MIGTAGLNQQEVSSELSGRRLYGIGQGSDDSDSAVRKQPESKEQTIIAQIKPVELDPVRSYISRLTRRKSERRIK